MNEDKVIFDISESVLDGLIYGLKEVNSNLSTGDRVKIEVDFNSGKIIADVEPRKGVHFEVRF